MWSRTAVWVAALCLCCDAAAAEDVPQPPQFFVTFTADPAHVDTTADRYGLILWHNHPRLRDLLAQVKRRNPRVVGLMYRDAMGVYDGRDGERAAMRESVGELAWIEARHPEWFQRDAAGRRIEVPEYPGRWMMDFGQAGWQEFWIERTLAEVAEGGWDGVMADDVLTTLKAHHLPALAGYPTDEALQRAAGAFLAKAHAAFQQRGKLFIANVSNTYFYPGLWERWLEVTDGLFEEHFAGEGWTWGRDVAERQLEALRAAAARGKWVLCFTDSNRGDTARMRSSLAAYLAVAGPRTLWLSRSSTRMEVLPWDASWAVALGEAVAEPVVQEGLWIRQYRQGLALANADQVPRRVHTTCGDVTLAPREGRIVSEICPSSSRSTANASSAP